MGMLFGTDGIRGKANSYPITPEVALQVGKAIAKVFGDSGNGAPRAVIGKDTRLSGYMLETALTSGLVSMGMDVLEVGPMPTPAVAHLTKSMCADCGIMITASHNPSDDNGIKIFSSDGFKLPDEVEDRIEAHILAALGGQPLNGVRIGKAFRIDDARGRYIEFAKSSIRNKSLKGIKAVLDCANGASYAIAPLILKELGVDVIKYAVEPDGSNINANCGATHTGPMCDLVRKHGADIGISLDGDSDRVIFSDAQGNVVNGDRILGLCALNFKNHGRLSNNTLVVTSMSNLGLVKAMKENGVKVETTAVGDRYVIERMREGGYNLGGEQSGHLIFLDYATTGDGIISALHVLNLMKENNKSIAEMANFMEEFPQKLSSMTVKEKKSIENVPALHSAIKAAEKALGATGRVNVRYSGTENKIRILVEAKAEADVQTWTDKLLAIVKKELC